MANIEQRFAAAVAPDVIKACTNTGVFPSVVIAQAMQESGSGTSKQARLFKNFFGHIATKLWGGKSGKTVPHGRLWRIYDSVQEAITGHINVLKAARYKIAGVFKAKTPLDQALALQKAGYNAGPDRNVYAQKLYKKIKQYDLEQYDRQMISTERQLNENGLAYSEQSPITRTLHNIFA